MLEAQNNMVPAEMDIGIGNLVGVTVNRRAPNPWVRPGTIDPHLGVIGVNFANGTAMATVWNFATHGTCYGPDNMKFSSDIMGAACDSIEDAVGGVALFINADAGDIDPTSQTCDCGANGCAFAGAPIIATAVKQTRAALNPTSAVQMSSASVIVPFGETDLNMTLVRMDNCSSGGPLDLCSFCLILDCDANIHLPSSWVEESPRFTAFQFTINGVTTVGVTIPGEALIELGWQIRNDTQKLGFDQTLLFGYSNNHMGYFATSNEYDWGGYESTLTLWGVGTADKIRASCKEVATIVAANI